jgi:predicted nucleic acid-binding protein
VPSPLYLADSNILLRLVKQDSLEYPLVRGAVHTLRQTGVKLGYTLQNMAEFWNASTRPKKRNGFGLTVEETERNAQEIERSFTFLPDTEAVYREWRRIVVQYGVSGVQVHDSRLAAAMYAHRITHILTFNGSDFNRFAGLIPVHPEEVQP